MKMDSQRENDKVWHYLHGLLSDAEIEAFESRLESDLRLREQVAEARLLDAALKAARPYVGWSEDQLEAHLLDAWEKDRQTSAASEKKPQRVWPGVSTEWFLFWTRPIPYVKLGVAAAFCVLLAASSVHLSSDFTTWTSPVVTMPAFRGIALPAEGAQLEAQRQQIDEISRSFEQSLERSYRTALGVQASWWSPRSRREWQMGLQIQSFRQGVISVHVKAEHRKDTGLKMEWTEYFSDIHSFIEAQEDLGTRIADALATAAPR